MQFAGDSCASGRMIWCRSADQHQPRRNAGLPRRCSSTAECPCWRQIGWSEVGRAQGDIPIERFGKFSYSVRHERRTLDSAWTSPARAASWRRRSRSSPPGYAISIQADKGRVPAGLKSTSRGDRRLVYYGRYTPTSSRRKRCGRRIDGGDFGASRSRVIHLTRTTGFRVAADSPTRCSSAVESGRRPSTRDRLRAGGTGVDKHGYWLICAIAFSDFLRTHLCWKFDNLSPYLHRMERSGGGAGSRGGLHGGELTKLTRRIAS